MQTILRFSARRASDMKSVIAMVCLLLAGPAAAMHVFDGTDATHVAVADGP